MGGSESLPEFVVTPRLRLRMWRPDDATALSAAVEANLDRLRPWMVWAADEPLSAEARQQLITSWVDDWETGGDVHYGVFLNETVVGACGLHRRGHRNTLEIGYWVHVDHVRQGYATELSRYLVAAAFAMPGIDEVWICHDKANIASRAIPESLGFKSGPERSSEILAPAHTGTEYTWVMPRTAAASLG